MEFTAKISDVNAAVQHAVSGIPSNPLMPVRAGMHVRAGEDAVSFTGSDGDITFTAKCGTDLGTFIPGEVVVPGKMLAEVVKNLPGEKVRFSDGGTHLRVSYGRGFKSEFSIRIAEMEYPASPQPAYPAGVIASDIFADAIRRTAPAASRTGDPALTAVRLEAGDVLTVVATDKFRVAAVTCKWFPEGWDVPAALLPARAAERFVRGITGDVEAGWNESVCTLKSGELEMTTRLIAGTYPDWRQVIPDFEPDVEVPLDALAGAVKRAQLAAESDSPVRLRFIPGELIVEAQGGSGRSQEHLPAGYDGSFSALFGIQYLLDGLSGCDGECRLGFTEPLKPAYIYSGTYHYTLLPRREI